MNTPFGKIQVISYNHILINCILSHCYEMVHQTLNTTRSKILTENKILRYWLKEIDRALCYKQKLCRENVDKNSQYKINQELQNLLLDLNLETKDILSLYKDQNRRKEIDI